MPAHLNFFLHQTVIGLHMFVSYINILTIVVSAIDPKLLIKMLHVTFTGGPVEKKKREKQQISQMILIKKQVILQILILPKFKPISF